MGAGDRHGDAKFSVALSGKGDWPFDNPEEIIGQSLCGECGAEPPTTWNGMAIHIDARDLDRPTKRVCFGKVVKK